MPGASQTNETLQTLLDVMPAGVIVCDDQGNIVLSNPAANTAFGGPVTGNAYAPDGGYSLRRLDGTPFPPEELPLSRAVDHGVVTTDSEILIHHADQSEVIILASGAPIRDVAGRVTGAIAVFLDVTEHHLAEAERAHLLSLAEVSRARFQTIFDSTAKFHVFLPSNG